MRPRKKDAMKKAQQTLYDQKDHLPWNTGQENKVLKRPIDLTGINKVPIVGLCPVGKSPTRL